jgi:hypothetical protein
MILGKQVSLIAQSLIWHRQARLPQIKIMVDILSIQVLGDLKVAQVYLVKVAPKILPRVLEHLPVNFLCHLRLQVKAAPD